MPYGPSTWLSGSNSANEPVRLAKLKPMRVGKAQARVRGGRDKTPP
jgi:hypothetical protein